MCASVGYSQSVLEAVVQLHYGSLVATAIAVVGGAEYGDHIAFVTPVIALGRRVEVVTAQLSESPPP